MGDVTQLLVRARGGDSAAGPELLSLVYEELRAEAARMMAHERAEHTLGATAVVHEAAVRLLGDDGLGSVPDRRYFFASALRAMRQVLVDHARRRNAARRGGDWVRRPLDVVVDRYEAAGFDLDSLSEAMDELERLSQEQFEVVQLRWFAGFTVREIAELKDCSVSKVESDARCARAFLLTRLEDEHADP